MEPVLVVALGPKEGVTTDEGRGCMVSGPDWCLAMISPPSTEHPDIKCHVVSDANH